MPTKINPIFKGLPKTLKTLKRFDMVEKQILKIMKSDHSHNTVKGYLTCAWCQKRYQDKQALIKKLGFASYGQYSEWRKVMGVMQQVKDYKNAHKK